MTNFSDYNFFCAGKNFNLVFNQSFSFYKRLNYLLVIFLLLASKVILKFDLFANHAHCKTVKSTA